MKYSLSNLLFVTALVAIMLGWVFDRQRLVNENERLNSEAADLLGRVAAAHGSGRVLLPGEVPDTRTYNFTIEQDRIDYLKSLSLPGTFTR